MCTKAHIKTIHSFLFLLQAIAHGEELRVWYSEDYASLSGYPMLSTVADVKTESESIESYSAAPTPPDVSAEVIDGRYTCHRGFF